MSNIPSKSSCKATYSWRTQRYLEIFLVHTSNVPNFAFESKVSNVTGENLDYLKMFMNLLSSRSPNTDESPAEFQIDDTYSVPGVGTVVSGTNLKGTIRINDSLLLGPDPLGHFHPIAVK